MVDGDCRPSNRRRQLRTTTGGASSTYRARSASSQAVTPCDSWNRWSEDVSVLTDLGIPGYRFSLEWSRIEPSPGEWSQAALDHYVRVAESLREAGVAPIITLNHFTLPSWLADLGSWVTTDAPQRFAEIRGAAPLPGGRSPGQVLHPQRAQHGRDSRLPHGSVPTGERPRPQGPRCRDRPVWSRRIGSAWNPCARSSKAPVGDDDRCCRTTRQDQEEIGPLPSPVPRRMRSSMQRRETTSSGSRPTHA